MQPSMDESRESSDNPPKQKPYADIPQHNW